MGRDLRGNGRGTIHNLLQIAEETRLVGPRDFLSEKEHETLHCDLWCGHVK